VELSEKDARYKTPIEIKETDGKVFLVVDGQRPLELQEREKDIYSAVPLPDNYAIKVKRSATGKIEGIIIVQPQGDLPFKPVDADNE